MGTDLGDVFNLPFLYDHATTDVSVWMSWVYLAWQFWESLPLTEFSLLLQVHQLLSVFQQADQGLLNLNWIAIFYRIISYIWKRFFIYPFQAGHPAPLPYPIECKHLDYGLQHKISIKPIFTLFFTNMGVESVWLWRISGIIRRDDVGNKFSQEWHNKIELRSRVSYLTNHI